MNILRTLLRFLTLSPSVVYAEVVPVVWCNIRFAEVPDIPAYYSVRVRYRDGIGAIGYTAKPSEATELGDYLAKRAGALEVTQYRYNTELYL